MVLASVAVPLALVGTLGFAGQVMRSVDEDARLPAPMRSVRSAVQPLASFNTYGLFARMTDERLEIRIEGRVDGEDWQTYRFRYKPDALDTGLPWVAPHMPRLDWQMWFAALEAGYPPSRRRSSPWFQNLLLRLFAGEEAVLALLAHNPFPDEPPQYLRATVAPFTYTSSEARRESGRRWEAGERRGYFPVVEKPFRDD